jgi:hypothetical protein
MDPLLRVFRLGLLLGLWAAIPGVPATAQATAPNAAQPPAPGLRALTGDDAQRASALDQAIAAALKADRWDEAIARAEDLIALQSRVQGPKHFETVDAEWRLDASRQRDPNEDAARGTQTRTQLRDPNGDAAS